MPELKVLTINIWNRQGPWPARLALLRRGIERLLPDVIGLQEVIHGTVDSQAIALARGLGYRYAFGEAIARGDGSAYGNAVLSRFPIGAERVHPLPGADLDEPRSALAVRLVTPFGRLPVMVTHLAYRPEHGFVRERQALALADIADAEAPAGERLLPAILMGDFNAAPEATELRFLAGLHAIGGRSTYFADCYQQCGEPPGYTFDGRHNPFAAPWLEPPRRIDYILVRGPDADGRGKPLAAQVVFTELVDGVAASDHYGVLAAIRM
jgi:endonuclease/exonuclease/phosphatase family metal-dependent hydrolase